MINLTTLLAANEQFRPWLADHIFALITISGLTFLTIWSLRKRAHSRRSCILQGFWAIACLTSYPISVTVGLLTSANWDLSQWLPFHLCDVLAFIAGFAILTRKPLLCELTYYYGLGATLQALITPNLEAHAPAPYFFSFFQLHGGIVAVALILPLGLGWRPRFPLRKLILRMVYASSIYLIIAAGLNALLDTNFMFLRTKPEQASLFDYMGPWPWYVASAQILAIAIFVLLSLPFFIIRKNVN